MKIELFSIVLILKTFLLSQIGVEAGALSCKTDADCRTQFNEVCFKYKDINGKNDICMELKKGLKYGFQRV